MCDPITIAGIALGGAGAAANAIGAGKVADATARTLAANLARQQELDAQASKLNDHSLGLYGDFAGQTEAKSKSLGDYFGQAVQPVATSGANVAPGGSANTQAAESAARGAAQKFSNQQAAAGAKVRAFGDVLGNDALLQGRDASQLGQLADFKRGDTGVMGLQLNQDTHAGDGWDLAGSIASGLGNVGIKAGLSDGWKKLRNSSPLTAMFGYDPKDAPQPAGSYNLPFV
ncbi:conserved hypothetical protein [Methylocella silvestris BL2]|uniref:Uncharacterized protein n=1 Tax=Methylocella silvestris (strain DSM 15510 / CIP 108128 / LMG 27833 / NCIMB 13906 / BL2) TaxID=395965 RepID=B8EKY8_METSB|nr:hypothetical protein [Methylocella silvestris]ACK52016.1 conserved hypothetical protein [Methylocella silvestris BL2]